MKIKLLIVDDEPLNIELLEALLEADNYTLFKARNGEEALESIKINGPDIVLLDIVMPGMSGFEVLEEIRKNEETKALTVILLTALSGRESMVRGLDAGADDYITKPFDKVELLSRVRTHVRMSLLRRQISEKEKLAGVMEIMREGAVVTDAGFNIKQFNAIAMEMLGLKNSAINLADHLESVYGYLLDKNGDFGRATISRKEKNPDNPLFLSLDYRMIAGPGGGVKSYVFVFKDVTEEYTRNNIILHFLSLVSKKLQTPMNVISGYAKIIGFFAAEDKLRGSVSSIIRNSLIMETLMKRSMYFVELGNTSTVGHLKKMDLKELAGRLAGKYGKKYRFVKEPDNADVQYWQRIVIEELVENAFKYNRADEVVLDIRIDHDAMTIEDNGPGISDEEREKVFEEFYEVNRNLPGNTSSAGLGLAIVKRLAESVNRIVTLEHSQLGGLKAVISKKSAEAGG